MCITINHIQCIFELFTLLVFHSIFLSKLDLKYKIKKIKEEITRNCRNLFSTYSLYYRHSTQTFNIHTNMNPTSSEKKVGASL